MKPGRLFSQLLHGGSRRLSARHLGADDEHHAVGELAAIAASVTAMTGGESMITQSKCSLQRRDEILEALRAEQLRGIRRNAAGGQHPQARHAASCARPRSASALPTSRLDRPGSCVDVEHLVHPRTAHVGVDQQHALAGLRQADRQVGRDQRLAFAGAGARDDERARALLGRREQDVGPDGAERLGEVRRDAAADQRIVAGARISASARAPCRVTAARGAS